MVDKNKDKDPGQGSFWDDDEIREAADTSQFIKFDHVGDTCTGVIKELEKGKDPWDRLVINVTFEDGRTAPFAQTTMVRDLFVYMPLVGETLTVTLGEVKAIGGGKSVKLFTGEITRLDGSVEKFDQTPVMQLTLIGRFEGDNAVCQRCLESVDPASLEPVVGLESGDEWWCEDCLGDVEPIPVECARCTGKFDSNEQHAGGRWFESWFEDGEDAYFCEYCVGEMPELLRRT